MAAIKEIRQNVNKQFGYVPYIVSNGNERNKTIVQEKVINNQKLVIERYDNLDINIYAIGCIQLSDDIEHKKGYRWSTRASVINKEFGTELIMINYNGHYAFMEKCDLEIIIPDEYYIEKELFYEEQEPNYIIKKRA